jgi:hypothetical protein
VEMWKNNDNFNIAVTLHTLRLSRLNGNGLRALHDNGRNWPAVIVGRLC